MIFYLIFLINALKAMKKLILITLFFLFLNPAKAVTTKMFRVLDTCARYRLGQITTTETLEKLKLRYDDESKSAENIIKGYCSVFTPNEKIQF